MTVKYAKNSGMTQKGFTPLTVNGEKVQNVTYGTSGKYYTNTYTFNVPSLKTLKHLLKGTLHVTVPTVGIDETFTVQFKFSHNGSAATGTSAANKTASGSQADQASASDTDPTATTTGSTAADTGTLPQTRDHVAFGAIAFGIVGLISSVIFWKRGI